MTHQVRLILIFLIVFTSESFGQSQDVKNEIAEKLTTYFKLERENIHLHLNKDTYLSDEKIWFKGYTYNRKELLPFYNTMNVFVTLFNQEGTKISQQLAYSNTGSFEGVFKDLEDLPSGNYYIQVYTNWMNNFKEDESSIYPVKILNASNPEFFDTTITNLATAKIEINPEGGNLIYGIPNSVGIKIADSFKNPIGNVIAELRDHANNLISEVAINAEGFGKVLVTPANEIYSISVNLNGNIIKEKFPNPSIKGISLEINNYALTNKASVKIKTNASTYADLKSKQLFLVVHQDERALLFDIAIDPKSFEQILVFSTENMSTGVNTVRVIDQNMNQLAERSVIKLPATSPANTLTKIIDQNGFTKINGKSAVKDANLSVSILPSDSKATQSAYSIAGSFLCNSYLNEPLNKFDSYSKNASIATKYELDLALLNQSKSKYSWTDILNNPPSANYEFDMGLTVKGKLVTPILKDPVTYNVRLRSYHHQILVQSPLDREGEFEFKHLILSDSTTVDFGLFKNIDANPLKMTHNARITNGKRESKFAFKGFNKEELNQPFNSDSQDLPDFFEGMVNLKAVEVEAKKVTLTRDRDAENRSLRGFKVPESMTIDVLTYIGTNGFSVRDNGIEVSIITRFASSINGSAGTPIIYLDNVQLRDFSFLQNLRMDELDEIYLNPTFLLPSIKNNQGMIRMYRKVPKFAAPKSNLKNLVLQNGFARVPKFENANYSSTSTKGFSEFGVINWIPFILTDAQNAFQVDVPNFNQKKAKVIIEGFTFDGELISETQIIDL